ncbi:ribonuclease P protein subunit [Candidatus Woesearchaeota archaeon]|nr:ribonuclease P protein subunit [Candidatus Woesearchaeota archaeon]
MNLKKLLRAELIGLKAEVVDSSNKANIGIKGKITDETKNTLRIGGKTVLKKDVTIEFDVDGKKIRAEGKMLMKSPEERVKSR